MLTKRWSASQTQWYCGGSDGAAAEATNSREVYVILHALIVEVKGKLSRILHHFVKFWRKSVRFAIGGGGGGGGEQNALGRRGVS